VEGVIEVLVVPIAKDNHRERHTMFRQEAGSIKLELVRPRNKLNVVDEQDQMFEGGRKSGLGAGKKQREDPKQRGMDWTA
jgi:hypothetical protein